MPSPADGRPSATSAARIVLAVAVTIGLVTALVVGLRGTGEVATVAAAGPTATTAPAAAVPAPASPSSAASVRATTLDVPKLGISGASLVELGVDGAGALVPPASAAVPGWFTGSAAPGAVGPTVIAGHVDSHSGPGIFYHLDALAAGDIVTVGRSDGAVVRYRVTDVLVVLKAEFPTDRVYGPTQGPELRLITCGGEFDRSIGHYLRNVVVSAVMVGDYPGSP